MENISFGATELFMKLHFLKIKFIKFDMEKKVISLD